MKDYRVKARVISYRTYTVSAESSLLAEEKIMLGADHDPGADQNSCVLTNLNVEIDDTEEV